MEARRRTWGCAGNACGSATAEFSSWVTYDKETQSEEAWHGSQSHQANSPK